MTVRVVTDSAADMPAELAEELGIVVVPLTVRFGDDTYVSGVDLSGDEFWEKLKTSSEAPATAAPSAGDFQKAFQDLLDAGADGIVAVLLSSALSATYQSAALAAQEIGGDKVHVVDSLAVSGGTGLLAVHAVERAKSGASAQQIATELEDVRSRIRLFGALDTLEYLRRGGRIGGAQALLGTMLKVKPIISLEGGVVEPVSRVRTRAKSLEHLVQLVADDKDKIEQIVAITGDAADSDHYMKMLNEVTPISAKNHWNFGPIVGTHGGPGLVGIAYLLKPQTAGAPVGDGGSPAA